MQRDGRPLILTKIAPFPGTSGPVRRDIVQAHLPMLATRRLTLVQAPAGHGKTGLLADWFQALRTQGATVAWLTLGREDADAGSLVAYLLAALGRTGPVGLPQLVEALAQLPEGIILFLDDAHRADSDDARTLLRDLIRLAPASTRFVIATRHHIALGQPLLAIDGALLMLGPEDLRFTPGEVTTVLDTAGLDDPAATEKVLMITQAWPVAVRMAVGWWRQAGGLGFVENCLAHPPRDLMRYLDDEVLAEVPADLREATMRLAVADTLTGDLAGWLCDRPDGGRLLERLEDTGLFLSWTGPERRECHFHPLFAAFLRDRVARTDPDLARRLHLVAARWFAAAGQLQAAVTQATQAADEAALGEIIDAAGGWRLIPAGHLAPLAAGMALLSAATIDHHPRLGLAQVYLLIKQGETVAARAEYNTFLAHHDRGTMSAALRAEIALVGNLLAEYEDVPLTLEDLRANEALLADLPPDDHLPRALVNEALGARYCDRGWLGPALPPVLQARHHHRALKSLYGEIFTHFLEARIRLAQGDMREAHGILGRAARLIDTTFGPGCDLAAQCALYRAELHYERDELTEAQALLDKGLVLAERSDGWLDLYASAFLTASSIAAIQGLDAARAIIARMRRLADARQLRQLALLADIQEVDLHLLAGQDDEALSLAATIDLPALADSGGDGTCLHQVAIAARLCMVRLDLADGNTGRALAELERLTGWCQEHGQGRLLVRVHLLAAAALEQAGRADADIRFETAVGAALFQGFVRPFIDGWRFSESLIQARPPAGPDAQPDRFREQFMRQLRRALSRHPPRVRQPDLLSAAEMLTLRQLNHGYTNKEIARLLNIAPDTVKYRLKSLYAKLGVETRRDAVRVSRERQLVTSANSPSV